MRSALVLDDAALVLPVTRRRRVDIQQILIAIAPQPCSAIGMRDRCALARPLDVSVMISKAK